MQEPEGDSTLKEAERIIVEGEERVARQLRLVNALDAAGRREEARAARELLAALTDALDAARRHWQVEHMAQRARRPWQLKLP